MEFPTLGKHCFQRSCKQLDFLPMKCDACSEVFCKDHIQYSQHQCSAAYRKDVQVPVCPLCNKPIPVKRGEAPDIQVSRHIDTDCQSDPAKEKRRVFSNRCSLKGCKQKELVPVLCSSCHKNFCLRHRHTTDHSCKGFQNSGRSMSQQGAAAINRSSQSSSAAVTRKPQQSSLSTIGGNLDRARRDRASQQVQRGYPTPSAAYQAGMSEDEAMSRAIQMSLQEQSAPQNVDSSGSKAKDQEAADRALAQALQESEQEEQQRQQQQQQQPQQRQQQRTRRQQSSEDSKCHVS